MLRGSLEAAKLGRTEKLDGFKRLDRFVQAVEERYSPEANFNAVLEHERAISPALDGRSVFHDRKDRAARTETKQLPLF